jgi:LAS superfamily LD-carboxypeptidase LdcB
MKKYLLIFFFILVAVIISYSLILLGDKLGLDFVSGVKDTVSDMMPNDKKDEDKEENIDTRPLEISYKNEAATIYESQFAIAIKSNKEIELKSNMNRVTLFLSSTHDNSFWYAAEVNNIGVGDSQAKFEIGDKAGNVKEVVVPVSRKAYVLPFGMDKIEDWDGSTYTADADNILAMVDKKHKLIDDYAPTTDDLVDVSKDLLLYANVDGIKLRREAGLALKAMLMDLQAQKGKNLVVVSGYRSHAEQVQIYTSNVRGYGQEEADIFSARPGFSEHGLGTAIDLHTNDTGSDLFSDQFNESIAGAWLVENAANYGFVQSYPLGKENITGYKAEPWHYRYIGIENAKEFKASGLTLMEWLEGKK